MRTCVHVIAVCTFLNLSLLIILEFNLGPINAMFHSSWKFVRIFSDAIVSQKYWNQHFSIKIKIRLIKINENKWWRPRKFIIPLSFSDSLEFQERRFCNPGNNILELYSVLVKVSPREMCLNTEFFLVRIFPNSDWIRRDTSYLSLFSTNAGKYGPEKLRIWTLFTQCLIRHK